MTKDVFKVNPLYEVVNNDTFINYTIVINEGVFIVRIKDNKLVELYLYSENSNCRLLSITLDKTNTYKYYNNDSKIVRDDNATYTVDGYRTKRFNDNRVYQALPFDITKGIPQILCVIFYVFNKAHVFDTYKNCSNYGFDLLNLINDDNINAIRATINDVNNFNIDKHLSSINNISENIQKFIPSHIKEANVENVRYITE